MENEFAFKQLGEFVVKFQVIENQIRELIMYIISENEDFIEILITDLEFTNRIKKCDIVFSRFCNIHPGPDERSQKSFHDLMNSILKAAERRNELVHSNYYTWQNIHGETGLLRQNFKNKASKGAVEMQEEEILPKDLLSDIANLDNISERIEEFRLQVVDWRSNARFD